MVWMLFTSLSERTHQEQLQKLREQVRRLEAEKPAGEGMEEGPQQDTSLWDSGIDTRAPRNAPPERQVSPSTRGRASSPAMELEAAVSSARSARARASDQGALPSRSPPHTTREGRSSKQPKSQRRNDFEEEPERAIRVDMEEDFGEEGGEEVAVQPKRVPSRSQRSVRTRGREDEEDL
jgi:hypothetical protein